MRRLLPVLLVLAVAAPAAAGDDAVGAKTWKKVRDHVLPSKRECAWTDVAWRPSLWDAVIEANVEAKPILLWAMNGHPLACT